MTLRDWLICIYMEQNCTYVKPFSRLSSFCCNAFWSSVYSCASTFNINKYKICNVPFSAISLASKRAYFVHKHSYQYVLFNTGEWRMWKCLPRQIDKRFCNPNMYFVYESLVVSERYIYLSAYEMFWALKNLVKSLKSSNDFYVSQDILWSVWFCLVTLASFIQIKCLLRKYNRVCILFINILLVML